ncbi:hypothetical protein SCB71_05675 [Herbiconiux sp. KACC 21604]|uniref:hypothetical protein n=1 Tax=unclassified Herbiconiux TaxID=2618217 RepID=UPI001490BFBC|nr:hypothetical protein [Herbiconiux sp. SALV-R1]QJU52823.1 hypothetical protein HL652_03660 [Herbiconiux sp. SALV-R1]WPO87736.1 hypothetical protein SCB71_05675 [Herbiconiux sp. KACC 21604]
MTRSSAMPGNSSTGASADADAAGTAAASTGVSRRQFTTAAAWAAPVIALAVATPLASASATISLSIARDNQVTFTGDGDPRALEGTYDGTLSALNLPQGSETGVLTYTIVIPSGVTVSYGSLPAGWVVATDSPTLLVFQGPSLTSTNTTTTLPSLTFGGTIASGDRIVISIDAAEPGYQVADDELGFGA